MHVFAGHGGLEGETGVSFSNTLKNVDRVQLSGDTGNYYVRGEGKEEKN